MGGGGVGVPVIPDRCTAAPAGALLFQQGWPVPAPVGPLQVQVPIGDSTPVADNQCIEWLGSIRSWDLVLDTAQSFVLT